MLIELGSAVALVAVAVTARDRWLAWAGLLLLAAIWLSTALLQVPAHRGLSAGFDARTARHLVATNWLRTLAWSARCALLLWILLASRPA